MYSEKTPGDGQSHCPKHVEFYSKNKFEKLVHLFGFIIRISNDARSPERQIHILNTLLHYYHSDICAVTNVSLLCFSVFLFDLRLRSKLSLTYM